MSRGSRGLDPIEVIFDDKISVDFAGLLLTATLADRLGLEAAADELVDVPNADGGFRPGRKILTLVHSMIRGGSFIDATDALRAGDVTGVLGHDVMAPSTLGTFLRGFSFGHLRQFDRLTETALARPWAMGVGPDPDEQLVVDIDPPSAPSTGTPRAGRGSATPRRTSTTHSWPPAPRPVRCSMPACAPAQRTRPVGGPVHPRTARTPCIQGEDSEPSLSARAQVRIAALMRLTKIGPSSGFRDTADYPAASSFVGPATA